MLLSVFEIFIQRPIAAVTGMGVVAISAFLIKWFAGFLRM